MRLNGKKLVPIARMNLTLDAVLNYVKILKQKRLPGLNKNTEPPGLLFKYQRRKC